MKDGFSALSEMKRSAFSLYACNVFDSHQGDDSCGYKSVESLQDKWASDLRLTSQMPTDVLSDSVIHIRLSHPVSVHKDGDCHTNASFA